MRYRLLGGLEVFHDHGRVDNLSPKQRAIVAILLLEHDRVVSVDRLVEMLWDDDPDSAITSLHSQISRLRSSLEPGRRPRQAPSVLITEPPGYRLVADRADVDIHCFVDRTADAVRMLDLGGAPEALVAARSALDIWTGPLLPEFADRPFALAHAAALTRTRLTALETAADALLRLGSPAEGAALLEPEAAGYPDRERLQWILALALYRSDRQTEALRIIDQCRRALVEQAGLTIGGDLQRLEAAILDHDPSLDRTPDDPTDHRTEQRTGQHVDTGTTPRRRSTDHQHPDGEKTPSGDGSTAGPGSPPDADVARPLSTSPTLIGRDDEFAQLSRGLAAAQAGQGGFALVVGEPGIGKTRLAEDLVHAANEAGIVTAWARCPENRSAPAFFPMQQLGEQLVAAGFTDLPLVEFGRQRDAGDRPERFGFYRAVLENMSRIDQPVLLVIDDLQWADPDSLRLIEHTVTELRRTRTFLVATARPIAEDSSPAFVDCMAEITRTTGAVRIVLGGLDLDDVLEWLGDRSDVDVAPAVAQLVHRRTAGNPLFITELVELLAAEGRLDSIDPARAARAIPPGVTSVVRRRVSRLPQHTQQLLPVAATLGRTIDAEALAAAVDTDLATVLSALEAAIDVGLVVELDGQLAFSHILVADALAGEVNAVRRAGFHARAARAIAASAGADFGIRASEVSHHAYEGILAGTGDLAIAASSRAARLAEEQFAHEDAAALWHRVADALARSRPADITSRIDALVAEARALLAADMVDAAKAPIIAAVDAAAAAGSAPDMIRAALLANHEPVWANQAYGVVDENLVRVLERTLQVVEPEDVDTKALVLGAIAAELTNGDRRRHEVACTAAEEAARRSGRPSTLALVLNGITVPSRPAQLDARRAWALEILDIAATEPLDAEQIFAAHYHLAVTMTEIGDFDGALVELDSARRAVGTRSSNRLNSQLFGFRGALLFGRGQYAEASELLDKSYEVHRRNRRHGGNVLYLAALGAAAFDRGGIEDLVPAAQPLIEQSAYGRSVAEVLAFAMFEVDRPDVGASLVDRFDATAAFTDDYMTVCAMSAALHVRIELGDRSGAAHLADSLAPYADRWACAGTSPMSVGPAALALARHAASIGEHDVAGGHFDDAVTLVTRAGAQPWLARTLVFQGTHLVELGEFDRAHAAFERAHAIATRYGLPYVERRLAMLVS